MHSCHIGDEDDLGDGQTFFRSVQVGGRTAQQALLQWVVAGKPTDKSRFDPPCLWNQSQHAPFQNSCNPTCVRGPAGLPLFPALAHSVPSYLALTSPLCG